MSFGKELSDEFEKLTAGQFYYEVELFTKLKTAFVNLSQEKYRYAIDIIHGKKSQVQFANRSSWIGSVNPGKVVRCELSDMLFLIISEEKGYIRLMYMQNKRSTNSSSRFKADLIQLHLLKDRCEIVSPRLPDCVFGDRNILTNAILPSVASYGVFYKSNDTIEMAYYPASNINPNRKTGRNKYRLTKYNPFLFGNVQNLSSFEESQGEANIEDFANALVEMKIGTPILPGTVLAGNVADFLNKKSPVFQKSRLYGIYSERLIENEGREYSKMPVVCVINADAIINDHGNDCASTEPKALDDSLLRAGE